MLTKYRSIWSEQMAFENIVALALIQMIAWTTPGSMLPLKQGSLLTQSPFMVPLDFNAHGI